MTTVINLKTDKDPGAVYIGRPTIFGNPFPLVPYDCPSAREACLNKYRDYFNTRIIIDPHFNEQIHLLNGKTLACWCHPKPCHGHVIAHYLNEFYEEWTI